MNRDGQNHHLLVILKIKIDLEDCDLKDQYRSYVYRYTGTATTTSTCFFRISSWRFFIRTTSILLMVCKKSAIVNRMPQACKHSVVNEAGPVPRGNFRALPPKSLLVPPKREMCLPKRGLCPKEINRLSATGVQFEA